MMLSGSTSLNQAEASNVTFILLAPTAMWSFGASSSAGTSLLSSKKLPRCLVGIEACASSHHWSRELQTLGHTVRRMPPAYVKPYVKRHKNDAADALWLPASVIRGLSGLGGTSHGMSGM